MKYSNTLASLNPSTKTGMKTGPETRHYIRFASTAEQLRQILETARVVGIEAEPITDSDKAGDRYAMYAQELNRLYENNGLG